MNNIPFNIEGKILPWLGRTMKCIDHYVNDRLHDEGVELTRVQLLLLIKLNQEDGQPQHSLAFITDRDKASLGRLINTLENKNLVARIPSKTDGRINHVYLTKHGGEIFRQTMTVLEKILNEIQGDLSPIEVEQTINVLKKIQKTVKTQEKVALQTKLK